jgi:hypothetical protein
MRANAMSTPDFEEYLTDEGATVNYPSSKLEQWVVKRGCPDNLYLSGFMAPKETTYGGLYTFYSEADVRSKNSDADGTAKPLAAGLLIIGETPSADIVAVDLVKKLGVIGLIGCAEVWQDVPVRKLFIPIAKSFDDLAKKLFTSKAPYDYAEAKKKKRKK